MLATWAHSVDFWQNCQKVFGKTFGKIRLSLKKLRWQGGRSGHFLLTPNSCNLMVSLRRMNRSIISDWVDMVDSGLVVPEKALMQRNREIYRCLGTGNCQHEASRLLSIEATGEFWNGMSRYQVENIKIYCLFFSISTYLTQVPSVTLGVMDWLCPLKFIYWIPIPQCDGIWRRGSWEVLKSWGWSLHEHN